MSHGRPTLHPGGDALTIRRARTKDQGEVGLGDAIAWFTRRGWTVSLPLVDNQSYDLVADDGVALHRVQVKTSVRSSRTGGWAVELRTNGGNQSRTTSQPFDPASCDLLYVLTDDGRWLIPTAAIQARSSITVGNRKWAEHRLAAH